MAGAPSFPAAVAPESARAAPVRSPSGRVRALSPITIVGSIAVLHSFGWAVDLMASGVIDAETMISDWFALDDYADAP